MFIYIWSIFLGLRGKERKSGTYKTLAETHMLVLTYDLAHDLAQDLANDHAKDFTFTSLDKEYVRGPR